MIPEWIDHELRNWGAWCWTGEPAGPPIQHRAASAEGRYIAPSDLGDEPRALPIRPNRERAEVVHRVYMTQLDRRERRVVVLRYVDRYPEHRVPKYARISVEMYATSMRSVARRINEAFSGDKPYATPPK